jgi:4-amino-4-deoxy-L-arabinose transferase-like glycosyltransferase
MSLTPPVPQSVSAPAASAPGCGLIGFVESRPRTAFAALLAVHFAVWTALPGLLYANLPLDLIEALLYGREWPLGSDKLPPLPWWMVETVYRLFGSDVAYYALGEASVVIAFALVFATARPLVGAIGALIAVLILDGMHYFQYTAVKFNHDVIQLPFWALAGYAFHAALKRGHIGHWLLTGFAFGGALWAKYFVVMLATPYALFLLFDRDARRALRGPGPWLGIALALLIAAPHLVWLVTNHFLPLGYVEERSTVTHGWVDHILQPAFFAGGQIFFLLPTLFIAAMFIWPQPARPTSPKADDFDRRIVTVLAFGPAAAMLAMIALSGRGAVTMWGYPLWIFAGLWIVLLFPRVYDAVRIGRVIAAWAAVFVAFAVVFVINYTVLPLLDHRYRAAFFPGDRLAAELTERYRAATGEPLRYVIGTMWDGGNVAHYSLDHPQVLIDGLARRAPWIDLNALRATGALVVWTEGDPDKLPAQFAAVAPTADVGTPFTLPARRGEPGEVHVGWAIVKPQAP